MLWTLTTLKVDPDCFLGCHLLKTSVCLGPVFWLMMLAMQLAPNGFPLTKVNMLLIGRLQSFWASSVRQGWGLGIWCCLGCQQLMSQGLDWSPSSTPNSNILLMLTIENGSWWFKYWVPVTSVGDLGWVFNSWLWPGQILSFAVIWAVGQLSFPLKISKANK